MTPDRSPDSQSFNSKEWSQRLVDTLDRHDPDGPCVYCFRSKLSHLTLSEAKDIRGYASRDCFICNLTDVPRPPAKTG